MKLVLNDYVISTDERQFIVYRKDIIKASRTTKAKNIGKEKLTPIGYFTHLDSALKCVPQSIIKSNKDLCVIIDKLNAIEGDIKVLIKASKLRSKTNDKLH